MKTKLMLLSLLTVAIGIHAFAQEEIDDMYFTSKDRAAYNATRQVEFASLSKRVTESESSIPVINPTDSYSARGVNPEYISGSRVGTNSNTSSVAYFSANYQPTAVNQALSSNNSFNNYAYNGFGSPWGSNRWGMNPYFGGMGMGFSPWGYNSMSMMNPYYDPWMMSGMGGFYQPGLSFGWGNSWGSPSSMFWNSFYSPYYGWGMNSFYGGWGNSFCNPWGWNSFRNPWGSSYYGNTVVVVDSPRAQSARNQEIDRYYSADNRGGTASGGRVSSEQYYNSGWRNDAAYQTNTNNGAWQTRTDQSTNAWNNNNNWNTNNSNWNNNNGWNNSWGGRSSSFSTGGGGGGFSGGSSGGGGGGGSRRGRD
ncbi:MAG: hypothetical protein ACKO96_11075 [Flammeovirgaceae bacterium]